MYKEKDWDEKYEEWKAKRDKGHVKSWKTRHTHKTHTPAKPTETPIEKVEHFAEKTVEEVESEIEKVEKEIKEYIKKKPLHIKILKFLAVLIPVAIIIYLISANFLVSQEFTFSYDIGSEGDSYLTPAERISEPALIQNTTYRNLTGHLVYFDVPIARGSEKIHITTKIKDNFPEDGKISLGARDQEEWHYLYKRLYNPQLGVDGYDSKGRVYRINKNLPIVDSEGLQNLSGITIASDSFKAAPNKIEDYRLITTTIDTKLRGGHEFYIYASEYLEIEVTKQDLNWYENSDELIMILYDLDGNVIELTQIRDDGIIDDSKTSESTQTGTLLAGGLAEGVYRLEIKDFDGLITQIKVNSNKIVTDKVFLADSTLYGVDRESSKLYFELQKDTKMRFITYHEAGLQKILFNKDGEVDSFNFDIEDEPMFRTLKAGDYYATFPKNDIVVESPEHFALTENSYFRPFKHKVIPVNSPDWILDSADYLITDYTAPEKRDGWIIVETEFDIEDDNLFTNDQGQLSLVFNIPHLGEESNYTIPIDWINITVFKPGTLGGTQ